MAEADWICLHQPCTAAQGGQGGLWCACMRSRASGCIWQPRKLPAQGQLGRTAGGSGTSAAARAPRPARSALQGRSSWLAAVQWAREGGVRLRHGTAAYAHWPAGQKAGPLAACARPAARAPPAKPRTTRLLSLRHRRLASTRSVATAAASRCRPPTHPCSLQILNCKHKREAWWQGAAALAPRRACWLRGTQHSPGGGGNQAWGPPPGSPTATACAPAAGGPP